MHYWEILLAITIFLINFRTHLCDLQLKGAQCGQKICEIEEYCSDFDRICKPCASICNQKHHNFDESECVKSCQVYLHNMKYVQKGEADSGGSLDKLKGEVEKLSRIVTITLTLVCFMFLVLALVLGFQLYRWKIKKNITFKDIKSKLFKKSDVSDDVRIEENKSKTGINTKPDLRLDISNISTISEHSPVTAITSISSRRPAEDSALDYSYDNHAMSGTPQ